MKALTVCQPHATYIALGQKPIENRTWATSYRGPIAIHAGRSRDWLDEDDDPAAHIFGAVVAVATLVECLWINGSWPAAYQPLRAHEHTHGPCCWVLTDVKRLQPALPWRGAQGLWHVPVELAVEIEEVRKVAA